MKAKGKWWLIRAVWGGNPLVDKQAEFAKMTSVSASNEEMTADEMVWSSFAKKIYCTVVVTYVILLLCNSVNSQENSYNLYYASSSVAPRMPVKLHCNSFCGISYEILGDPMWAVLL